jgi:aspartyl-tRNA(Asn)/glutamyl-tRNA(Gln) amidotransferase subunit A
MYLADIFTVSANLVGVPAVSVPCGYAPEGLPIGIQLTGRMWEEGRLVDLAAAYQAETDWHLQAPALVARA